MFEFTCHYDDGYSEPCSFWDAHMWPIFDAVDQSQIATFVKDQIWLVPAAGALHLLMLALIGGLVFFVDMRALGFGVSGYTPAELERKTRRPLVWAVVFMILSGVLLGLGEVMRLFESVPYHMKMVALFSALVFTFAARPRIYDPSRPLAVWQKVLAVIAISLWVYAFIMMASARAWWTMAAFVAVLALMGWIGARRRPEGEVVPFGMTLTALTSVALWMTIAVSGRWIAFY